MEERLIVNLSDTRDEDTMAFFNLLNPSLWEVLQQQYSDPENEKTLEDLVKELLGA